MTMENKGSAASNCGASNSQGPLWTRDWQFRQVLSSRNGTWAQLEPVLPE
jgi:hypothetical protein